MFLFVIAGTLLSISGISLYILSINPRGNSVERYRSSLKCSLLEALCRASSRWICPSCRALDHSGLRSTEKRSCQVCRNQVCVSPNQREYLKCYSLGPSSVKTIHIYHIQTSISNVVEWHSSVYKCSGTATHFTGKDVKLQPMTISQDGYPVQNDF